VIKECATDGKFQSSFKLGSKACENLEMKNVAEKYQKVCSTATKLGCLEEFDKLECESGELKAMEKGECAELNSLIAIVRNSLFLADSNFTSFYIFFRRNAATLASSECK
jgi:hypothetical protein